MRRMLLAFTLLVGLGTASTLAQAPRPVIDVHIHYSQDAWAMLPPPEAIKVLKQAGLKKAFVSSSSDDGTQLLLKEAPDLIVPVLRPYRSRGETGTWTRDPSVIQHVEARLKAGIGEFHAYGADADTPVMRRMVELAKESLHPELEWLGVVLNIADLRLIHAREALQQLKDRFGERVFESVIRRSVRYAESAERGVSILDYGPDLGSDYLALADEMLERLRFTEERERVRGLREELVPA